MLDTENQTLKDILIANECCTEEQLAQVVEEHERTGTPLQELLVDFGDRFAPIDIGMLREILKRDKRKFILRKIDRRYFLKQ